MPDWATESGGRSACAAERAHCNAGNHDNVCQLGG